MSLRAKLDKQSKFCYFNPGAAMVLTAKEVLDFITKESRGKFFAVEFIKRTTGQLRRMVCRYGVKSRRRGGEPAYDFEGHGLVCVFDTQKDEYRTLPRNVSVQGGPGLLRIKINGKWYKVQP